MSSFGIIPRQNVVNAVTDFGFIGDGVTDNTAALLRLVAYLTGIAGTSFGIQHPPSGAKAVYFPGGQYKVSSFFELETWGTGTVIFGDGRATQLDGIGILVTDMNCQVRSLGMRGAGTYGLKLSGSSRRGARCYDVYVRDRDVGTLYAGGANDTFVQCYMDKNTVGLEINTCVGLNEWIGCEFWNSTNHNILFNPIGSEIGTVKFTGGGAGGAGLHGIHIQSNGADEIPVECYFTGFSCAGQQETRTHSIVSIANAGGGYVTVETATPHLLAPGVGKIFITGTTDYDADYFVHTVIDGTHFTVLATFTTTKTGTLSLSQWDLYLEADDPTHLPNDFKFENCNFNYVYVGDAYSCTFIGSRPAKVQFYKDVGSRIFLVRDRRGRGENPRADVPISGPGSNNGWGEFAYTGDNDIDGDADDGVCMAVPYYNSAVGGDNVPNLNQLTLYGQKLHLKLDEVQSMDVRKNDVVGVVLANSAVSVPHTGDTSEATLATITVPANRMGANGFIRVRLMWSMTNSANNKTLKLKFGGSTISSNTLTVFASGVVERDIMNANAANSQKVMNGGSVGFGFNTAAIATFAIDTTSDQNVVITGQLADASETVTLEGYVVELFYRA